MATNTVTNIPIIAKFYNLTNVSPNTFPNVVGLINTVIFPLNGISAANSRFYFKIVDFNGDTVYQNEAFDGSPTYSNPDVLGANLDTWVNSAPLAPCDSNRNILKGIYTFTVIQRDESQSVTDLFTRTMSVDYNYDRPDVVVTPSINIFTPSIVLTDVTTYNVIDGTTSNPITPTITRAWKFYYPSVLDINPITGTGSTFTTYIFYEGDQEWKLTSTLTYSFDTPEAQDSLLVLDTIVTTDVIDIPDSLCDLFCCATSVESRFWAAKGTAAQSAIATQFYGVGSYMSLISNALICGSTKNVSTWMSRAKEVANCDDECDCGNDSGLPRQITGFGNPTITSKIEGTTSGTSAIFPVDVADKNRLIGKSWTNGEIQLYIDGIMFAAVGSSSTATFSSTTGEFTTSFTPSSGLAWTIQILK